MKLLRTLQEGEIKRVGSDETKRVDVRVLAATNVDLAGKIADGTFRMDLFYRLNVIAIVLPPLRERESDVELLAWHFVQKYARRMGRDVKRVTPKAMAALRAHAWPGNVRELEHAVEHAVVLVQGDAITPTDLPFANRETPGAARSGRNAHGSFADFPYVEAKKRAMEAFDRAYLAEVLRRVGGNLSEAARQVGLDRSNFRRLVRKSKGG